eukprot:SAG25_NODE_126_length_14581_cov_5.819569_5_plen_477_part_00
MGESGGEEAERQVSAICHRHLPGGDLGSLAAAIAEPFSVHVRWDEQGVALAHADIHVAAGRISMTELKSFLEQRLKVPVASQHLQTMAGVPIFDDEVFVAEVHIVMCEQFIVRVVVTEYDQPVRDIPMLLSHSLSVTELRRRIGQEVELPPSQLRMRSAAGLPLQDDTVLSHACTVHCADALRFVLRVKWVEQEVVLDPRQAKWAGNITLGETALRCDGVQSVAQIKVRLQTIFGVAESEQRLGTSDGRLIGDNQKIAGNQEILLRAVGEALLIVDSKTPSTYNKQVDMVNQAKGVKVETLHRMLAAADIMHRQTAFEEEKLTVELLQRLAQDQEVFRSAMADMSVTDSEQRRLFQALHDSPSEQQPSTGAQYGTLVVVAPPEWAADTPSIANAGGDDLGQLLAAHSLQHLIPTFQEEALTLSLLCKMATDSESECHEALLEVGVVEADARAALIQSLLTLVHARWRDGRQRPGDV